MAKDKEIEIKIVADTSDVDKSMKQVSKSADKMGKDVAKAGNKAEDSFDDLKKTIKDTTKQVSDIFKNVKTTGLKTAMKDVVKTTSEATKTIKKQFKDVLNMEGTLKFTATADVESGANQAKAGASDLAKQVMTSGAMGSQIAKQMAQGFDEGTDKIADTVNELKDVLTDVDLSTGIDKETEKIETRIKEINELMQNELLPGEEIGRYDATQHLQSIEFTRQSISELLEDLKAMKNGLKLSADAFEEWSIKLSGTAWFYSDLKGSTTELVNELMRLTEANSNGVIDTSNFEQLLQILPSVIKDIDRLGIKTQQIKFNEDFDVQPLKDLTQAFDETRRKADMRPIIELLEQLEQQTRDMGTPLKGLKELIGQINDELEHAGTPTDKAKDALSRYCHTLIEAGEKGNVLALSQDKVADNMKQMVESLSDTDNVLEQTAQASDKLESSLKKVDKQQDKVSKSTKKTENAFKSLAKSLAPYLGLAAIFGTIKKSISDALEAGEAGSMFDTVFGSSAEDMNIWISDMNKTLGLGITDTKKYTATIMQMGKAMEMTNENAMSMAQSMAVMAGDISSFYDTDIVQAQEDLRSALSGSYETMDKYGVMLRQTTVEQFAYENGIAAVGAELTNAQRAMATTLYIQNALGQANGDLARTIHSPANQLRILHANLLDVRTALGSCFTPILTVVLPILNRFVSALASVINKVADFIAKLFSLFGVNTGGGGIFSEVAESAEGIGTALADGLDKATGGASDVADTLKEGAKSAKEIMKELMGIDEINNLTPKDSTGGSGSDGSGGSDGGAGSGLGDSLAGLADETEQASDKVKDGLGEIADWIVKLAENLKMVWNALKAGFLSVSDYINTSIANLKQSIANLGTSIQEFLLGVWNNGGEQLVTNFGRLGGTVVGAIIDISGQCVQMVADLFAYMNPDTNPYTKAFINGLNNLLVACQNFALSVGGWFRTFVDNGGQAFLNVIGDIVMLVGTTLANTLANVINWITLFMNSWAGQLLIEGVALALDLVAGAVKAVMVVIEKLTPVWSALLTAFVIKSTIDTACGLFGKLASKVVDFGLEIASNIEDVVVWGKDILKTVKDVAKNFGTKLKDGWQHLKDFAGKLKDNVKAVLDWNKSHIKNLDDVKNGWKKFKDDLKQKIKDIGTQLKDGIKKIKDWCKDWKTHLSDLKTAISTKLTGIKTAFTNSLTAIKAWGKAMWTTVKDAVAKAWTSFTTWIASLDAATISTWLANAATWALNTALAVLTSPITLIIGAIILLVAIIKKVGDHFNWWSKIMDWLKEKCGWLYDGIMKLIGGVKEFFGWGGENEIVPEVEETDESLYDLGTTMEETSDRFGTACSAINKSLASINLDSNKLAVQLDEAETSFNESFDRMSGKAKEYFNALESGDKEALQEMAGNREQALEEMAYIWENSSQQEKAIMYAKYGEIEGITDGWLDYTKGSYEDALFAHLAYIENIEANESLSNIEKDRLTAEATENFKQSYQDRLDAVNQTIKDIENAEGISAGERNAALELAYQERDRIIDQHAQYEIGNIDNLDEAVQTSAQTQKDAYTGVADEQTKALEGVDKSLETTKENLSTFKEESDKVAKEIPKEWEGIGETISDEFEGALKGIKTNFTNILNNTQKQCTQLKSGLQATFNDVKTGVKKSMDEVNKTIKTKFTDAVNTVKNIGNGLKTSLQSIFTGITNGLTTSFTNIKNSMTNAFKSMSTSITSTMNSCKNTITNTLNSINTQVKSKTTAIKNTVSTTFNSLAKTFTSPFTTASKTITDSLTTMNTTIGSRLKTIVSTLQSYATKMKNTMNFNFPTPYLRMPHISVYGDWNFEKKTVPSFRVNWWSSGAIFNKRTILGNMGVGDAQNGYGNNPEAVLPLDSLWKELNVQFQKQNQVLKNNNQPIQVNLYLDGKVVTSTVIDNMKDQSKRGVLDTSWL